MAAHPAARCFRSRKMGAAEIDRLMANLAL